MLRHLGTAINLQFVIVYQIIVKRRIWSFVFRVEYLKTIFKNRIPLNIYSFISFNEHG